MLFIVNFLYFIKLKFIVSIILWYNFTLVSAIFTKYYLNATNGDSITFTLVTFGFGALVKVIFDFKKIGDIFATSDVCKSYICLAVCNVASVFLTNIAINQTTVSLIYVIKVGAIIIFINAFSRSILSNFGIT